MAKNWTHTAAFGHFGATPRNVQWSWSAKSADGKTVVVTLWQDLFEKRDGRVVYSWVGQDLRDPDTRLGFHEMLENIAWARDHCDGLFKVIIAIAKDPRAEPRSIKECFPSKMVMRLTSFDTETGAFVAKAETN